MFVKCVFALLSKIVPLFSDFNWHKFKSDIWYYYIPQGQKQWLIVYLTAGIIIPILINFLINKILLKFGKDKLNKIKMCINNNTENLKNDESRGKIGNEK